jgi:hypothetical protein
VGRQIINTQGAERAIARRRIIAAVVLLVLAVAVAAGIYYVSGRAPHGTGAHAALVSRRAAA